MKYHRIYTVAFCIIYLQNLNERKQISVKIETMIEKKNMRTIEI